MNIQPKPLNQHPHKTIISGNINSLDSRAAMGLSEDYVDFRFSDISAQIEPLETFHSDEHVSIIEDHTQPIERRYAAGQLLALSGDPRINPLAPTMITVPKATIGIGLEPAQVKQVVEEYESVGVLAEWIRKETPRFNATVETFKIAKYPITNHEYREFLLDNPTSEIPSSWKFGRYPQAYSNHPVYTISEFTAEAYCQWLSEKTGRHFRLPKEIEWEYAASGPLGFKFPWGETFCKDHANTAEFGVFDTTPVGLFPNGRSPFGVEDLAGNIEEYTADDYWAYPGGQFVIDDLVIQQQRYRIARGGSFTRFSDLARCQRRHGRYNKEIYVMGFRVAESIEHSI